FTADGNVRFPAAVTNSNDADCVKAVEGGNGRPAQAHAVGDGPEDREEQRLVNGGARAYDGTGAHYSCMGCPLPRPRSFRDPELRNLDRWTVRNVHLPGVEWPCHSGSGQGTGRLGRDSRHGLLPEAHW